MFLCIFHNHILSICNSFPCFFFNQQNVFPDRGTVYDYYFVKQANGSWNNWLELSDKKAVIPKDAKV